MKLNRSVREIRQIGTAGDCKRARIIYVASECSDAATAVESVRQITPESIGNANRSAIGIISSPGGGFFEVAVDYEAKENNSASKMVSIRNDGDRNWKFSVNSILAERKEAFSTVRSIYLSDNPQVSPGTRIHWNGQSGSDSLSGSCRILEPRFTEICRATFRESHINTSYKRQAAALVGNVNNAMFNRWAPGEVLLESITQGEPYCNSSGISLCDLVFTFAIRPNGPRTCAGNTVPDVEGWDHLWAITEIAPGESGETVHSLHISRIYERASFSALEI